MSIDQIPQEQSNFSSLTKFKMRERLGIKQDVKEADILTFLSIDPSIENKIMITQTPKDIMMKTMFDQFRRCCALAIFTFFFMDQQNYVLRKDPWWLAVYLTCEISGVLMIWNSYRPNQKLIDALYGPAIICAIRFQLYLVQSIFYFNSIKLHSTIES